MMVDFVVAERDPYPGRGRQHDRTEMLRRLECVRSRRANGMSRATPKGDHARARIFRNSIEDALVRASPACPGALQNVASVVHCRRASALCRSIGSVLYRGAQKSRRLLSVLSNPSGVALY